MIPTRQELHAVAIARTKQHDSYRLPKNKPCVPDADFKGMIGEEAICARYGGNVDLEPKRFGDGGKDIYLNTPFGRFRCDVKAAMKPVYLAVKKETLWKYENGVLVNRCTIYVLGGIIGYDPNDPNKGHCELLGWAWAKTLREAPTRTFKDYGILNHVLWAGKDGEDSELRPMSELDEIVL